MVSNGCSKYLVDTAQKKQKKEKQGKNYWNMIIVSNNDFCVPATLDNRRFFSIY